MKCIGRIVSYKTASYSIIFQHSSYFHFILLSNGPLSIFLNGDCLLCYSHDLGLTGMGCCMLLWFVPSGQMSSPKLLRTGVNGEISCAALGK